MARFLRLAQEEQICNGTHHPTPAAALPLSGAWKQTLRHFQNTAVMAGTSKGLSAQRSAVHTTAEFIGRYARQVAARARTLTGYNPLLHGYSNTQFLLVDNSLLGLSTASPSDEQEVTTEPELP
jgi:hypothetical protein